MFIQIICSAHDKTDEKNAERKPFNKDVEKTADLLIER